jgi:hypothetical protein
MRIQHRRGNGRWRQTTLADYGLKVIVCEECNGVTPFAIEDQTPTECSHCGKPFADVSHPQGERGE